MAFVPQAPTRAPQALRGDYGLAAADYRVVQDYDAYTPAEHALWHTLYARQSALLERYAAPEVSSGLRLLGGLAERIPRLEEVSATLARLTGWRLVGVPGLIPEARFFAFLAEREFPVTVWMRRPDERDYLVEPDLFHDFYGHLPMLTHPVFANYVQAYGERGATASTPAALQGLARLYWYTVEFGLVRTPVGARAYGAGILSSRGETLHSLDSDTPRRIPFDLRTVLATPYLIDAYQPQYFVLDGYDELFDSVLEADLEALACEALAG